MKIEVKTQNIKAFQFTTIGHWYFTHSDNTLHVQIATMSDDRYWWAVLFHELIEFAWCRKNGVTTAVADRFDEWFEEQYRLGVIPKSEEAGFHRACPYRGGHVWGARFERAVIFILGANWKPYLRECDSLMGVKQPRPWWKRRN